MKYLLNILTSNHFFYNFRAFNNDCKSRIPVWSDERSISNWSHASKSIQVDCRYAAPICSPLRLSISFSFSPLFLWFSASFSRSYLYAFSTFAPSFPCRGALEFAKLIARNRTHIFVSKKCINIRPRICKLRDCNVFGFRTEINGILAQYFLKELKLFSNQFFLLCKTFGHCYW